MHSETCCVYVLHIRAFVVIFPIVCHVVPSFDVDPLKNYYLLESNTVDYSLFSCLCILNLCFMLIWQVTHSWETMTKVTQHFLSFNCRQLQNECLVSLDGFDLFLNMYKCIRIFEKFGFKMLLFYHVFIL